MGWREDVKRRYSAGEAAFRTAGEAFDLRLRRFCQEPGIRTLDSNPEGRYWLLLLSDQTEMLVERRTYHIAPEHAEFWIEYDPNLGGVVADFRRTGGKGNAEVLVGNAEILDVTEDF